MNIENNFFIVQALTCWGGRQPNSQKNKKHHGQKEKESSQEDQEVFSPQKESLTFFSQPLVLRRAGFFVAKKTENLYYKGHKHGFSMIINLKTKDLEPTPSLHEFVEKKLGSLTKFLKGFEAEGVDEMTVTIARTTSHHAKGEVFEVKADLRLPKKVLRASEKGEDVRAAIDVVKRKLQLEIEKYKSLYDESVKKRI